MKNKHQKFEKALRYLQANDLNSATKELNEIIQLDNKNTKALSLLSQIAFQKKEYETALINANQILLYDPYDSNVTNLRGMIYQKIGNNINAKQDYKKAIGLNPAFKDARYNLIKLLINEQKYDQAIDYLKPLVDLKDQNALLDLAIIYLNHAKQFSESLKLFELFIKNNEADKRGYLGKIRALNYLNRNSEAIIFCDVFEEKFTENDAEFLNYKGIIYKENEDYAKAEIYFKKALKIKDNESIRRNLSGVYLLNKQFDKGWFYFTEKKNHGLKNIPDNSSIIFTANQGIGDQLLYVKIIHQIEKYSSYNIQINIDQRLRKIIKIKYPNLKIYNSGECETNAIITNISNAPYVLNEIAKRNNKTFEQIMDNRVIKIDDKKIKQIGIAWKSTNPNIGTYKTIDLNLLIDSLKGKEIHSLQYFDDMSEIKSLPQGLICKQDINYKNDIIKLYEIMSGLDLIVTISNFTAHLAGFFDIPTILLIPKGKGNIWYWHNEKESFWYPSMKIIKQKKNGDWSTVKDEIELYLK